MYFNMRIVVNQKTLQFYYKYFRPQQQHIQKIIIAIHIDGSTSHQPFLTITIRIISQRKTG